MSYDKSSRSLIDHVIVSDELSLYVKYCKILDDNCINVSCHRPIVFYIEFMSHDCVTHCFDMSVKWHRVSDEQLRNYDFNVSARLKDSVDQLPVNDIHCFIDNLYQCISSDINTASNAHLPHSTYRSYLKPYWSADLKKSHASMRNKRTAWIVSGRPRGSEFSSYREYKEAKRCFRAYHRNSSLKYLQKVNSDIDSASGVDSPLFWRLFNRKRRQVNSNVSSEIKFDEVVIRDPELICHEWGRHFASLYSDTECKTYDNTQFETVTTCTNFLKEESIVVDGDHISQHPRYPGYS